MLSEITSAIQTISSPEYRAEVYLAIAKQYNKNAETEKALLHIEQAIQALAKLPICESAFWEYEVAKQLANSGQRKRSDAILTKLLGWTRAEEGTDAQVIELERISSTYAEIGIFDRAIQIAQEIFDEFDKALALRSINITAILNSKHEQVANVILASSLGWQRDFVLSDTAGTYAYHLQAERAISLVGQILDPSQRVCALQGVFNCFVRRKADLEHWFGLLKEVESFVIAETHLSVKAQALRIMAGHRTRLNQFDHARSLLEEARQLAEGISLDEPDKSVCHEAVLNDIAHAWGELNRHMTHQSDDRAVAERAQTAEAVEEALAGDNAHIANLQRVLRVQSWIQQGSIEEALAIAEQITEASLKDLALRLAGVSPKAEYLDDVVQDLQKVCVSAS